jgi:hypothetical protein
MTLDDLNDAFDAAVFQLMQDAHHWGNNSPSRAEKTSAGIRAVVEALGDELCERSKYNWVNSDLRKEFNEILGIDEVKS